MATPTFNPYQQPQPTPPTSYPPGEPPAPGPVPVYVYPQQPYPQQPYRQQPYPQQPYPQQYAPAPPPPSEPRNGVGITALCLGITGSVIALIPILGLFGLAMGLAGVVLGIVALSRCRKGKATNRKTSWFGLGVSLLAVALGIVGMVIVSNAFNTLDEKINNLPTSAPAPVASSAAPATQPTPARTTAPAPKPTPTVTVTAPPAPAPALTPPPAPVQGVWMWAPVVFNLTASESAYVYNVPSNAGGYVGTVYGSAAIICSVQGTTVSTTYAGSSSNWDYVTSPFAGWVPDVFLDTRSSGHPNGAVAPRC
jgi:hypothetical protein